MHVLCMHAWAHTETYEYTNTHAHKQTHTHTYRHKTYEQNVVKIKTLIIHKRVHSSVLDDSSRCSSLGKSKHSSI